MSDACEANLHLAIPHLTPRSTFQCGSAATAAFSTTAGSVHLLLGCLAAYPEWQAKLQDEVDHLIQLQHPNSAPDDLPEFVPDKISEHARQTWAFIDEVLRYFPIFPISKVFLPSGGSMWLIRMHRDSCYRYSCGQSRLHLARWPDYQSWPDTLHSTCGTQQRSRAI